MRRFREPLGVARPDLLAEWDAERNPGLDPAALSAASGRLAWWRCQRAGHRWQARVYARADRDTGCPVCAPRARRPRRAHPTLLEGAPALAAQWHPDLNGTLRPGGVTLGSKRRAWWRCPVEPSHEWETEVHVRALKGSGCPACAGRRVTPETALSFTHPDVAAEWHPHANGALSPDQLTAGSSRRVWWRCQAGHEWQVEVGVRIAKGTGCPGCARHRRAAVSTGSQ